MTIRRLVQPGGFGHIIGIIGGQGKNEDFITVGGEGETVDHFCRGDSVYRFDFHQLCVTRVQMSMQRKEMGKRSITVIFGGILSVVGELDRLPPGGKLEGFGEAEFDVVEHLRSPF